MSKANEALAEVSDQLKAGAQALLGDTEQVIGATGATEGPNPRLRSLAFLVLAPALVLLPPLLMIPVLIVGSFLVFQVTSIWWKPCILATTDKGVVVFERGERATGGGPRLPAAVAVRSVGDIEPSVRGGALGFEIDGRTFWALKRSQAILNGDD